ncbi:MAG TPA: tRNA pseudouridine(55) synthase TruB [Acidimicrobiales bacterium]|nr:tRNA pseudouridine(55) synthase TruB [Acidimicrobiales bacterium]
MIDGLVVVDKAPEWTSHDVVAKCRGIFGQKRVGHAGTLDPDATGVLLVGLGGVTRLLRYLTPLRKTYTGEVVLGTETSTLDASGEVTATHDMSGVTIEAVRAAAAGLVGDILQVPPMVSAVQVGGKRLHQLARAGVEVEREPRPVTVYRYDVAAEPDPGVFSVEVECSSGTYVRSLAADLGTALGGGAHLRNLRRTAIGSFTVADAAGVEALDESRVLPPSVVMRDYPMATITAEEVVAAGHGKKLEPRDAGTWAAVDGDGRLIAVYDGPKPTVVLAATS